MVHTGPRLSTVIPSLRYLLLVANLCFPYVVGVGVFEVKLGEMHNPGRRDVNGGCCRGNQSNFGKCTSPCDTRIVTCLRQYSPAHPSDCTYGFNVSGLLGRNSFVIGKLVQFPISSNWPGSFSLKVTASVPGTKKTIIEALVKRSTFVANPQWNNYTYTIPSSGGLKISLSFTYRFICSKDNYGDDCSKSCTPRDDKFGHYKCDSDGNRVCLDGWGTGPSDTFCENPICNPACQNSGTCKGPNKCSCSMGWQGATCEQCEVYPGCAHGTCQDKWECNCNSGWGGPLCDLELDYCGRNKPCKHGDCRNTRPGRYKCICNKGYGGLNCESEINECASNPCQNGGNCTDKFAGYNCSCAAGFHGKQCEINIDDCKANACANGGTCIDGVNDYSCQCVVGFTGKTCDVKIPPTEAPTKSTTPYNGTYITTTSNGNTTVIVGQRKDDSSTWSNVVVNIVLPVVICVIVFVCIIVGIIIWRCYRKRHCCCAGSSTSSRDPEEPNTRTEVKRVNPDDGKDVHDLKRCRASTSNVKNTTPDIIINFVPSRPSNKNINSEKASRSRKGKELDSSPLESTRFAKPSNRSQETVT